MKKNYTCLFFLFVAGLLTLGMTPVDTVKSKNEMVIPFELKGHIILVKCKINDSKEVYDFIVDTGGRTFIDKTLPDELKLKQQGPMAKINTLLIGDFSFENVFVFTQFDFQQLKTVYGITINGMIGSDFLDDYTVSIDYRNRRMTLSDDTESFAEEKVASGNGYFLKFTKHPINNSPMITCKLNGEIEVEAMIDTGQPFPLVLPLNFLEKTGALKQKETLKAKGVIVKWPFTKPADNYLSRLKSLEIDGLKIKNLTTFYAELPAMLSVPLLGKDFLSQFMVKINYPKNEILLLPESGGKVKNNLFSIGVSIESDAENNIVVRGVWEKSPADKAGIEVGDQILEFNSKKLTPESTQEFNLLLQDEKVKKVEVIIKNKNGQRKILLKKENLMNSIGVNYRKSDNKVDSTS